MQLLQQRRQDAVLEHETVIGISENAHCRCVCRVMIFASSACMERSGNARQAVLQQGQGKWAKLVMPTAIAGIAMLSAAIRREWQVLSSFDMAHRMARN